MKYIKVVIILFILFPLICYGLSNTDKIDISILNNSKEKPSFNVGETYTYNIDILNTNSIINITNKFKEGFSFEGISSIKIKDKINELEVKSNGIILNNNKGVGKIIFKDNVLKINIDCTKLNGNININYDVKLNFKATIGNSGNTNTIILEENNKKYEDSIKVYTYALELLKYESNSNPKIYLNGSEYAIYDNKECIGDPIGVLNTRNASTLDGIIQDGVGIYSGLKEGLVYLKQTKAASGYRIDTKVREVMVSAINDYTSVSISEDKSLFLPEASGTSTYLYLGIGAMVIMTSGLILMKLTNNKLEYNIY